MNLATFDVFDTVLTRAIGSPESNFLLLGNTLRLRSLIDCSAEEFARIREKAEARAFHNAGGLDSKVDLAQIYAEVGATLRLTDEHCQRLMQVELAMETGMIRPVPRAAQLVQAARERQERIVYISDMYLNADVIQDWLQRHGLWQAGDRCYVSSEYAKSKAEGTLFREVLRREQVTPDRVCHYGNNAWSDVHRAQQVGLQVRPFLEGNLNRYEEILESYTWMTGGLSSAMAGASRLARLSVPAASPRDAALRDVTAGVAAPALVGFLLWVLRGAQARGLKRLYFVSRDGQILLEIARRLIQKLDFDCELRYLYGSRQAWMLPSITTVDEEQLAGIFTGKLRLDVDVVSAQIALARLHIEPEEIKASLATIGLVDAADWQRNLSGSEREALNQLVLSDRSIHRLILQKAAASRQLMTQYLKQEGLLEPVPMGMVDLGTGATLHYALSAVLAAAGAQPPVSFYLGLRGNQIEDRFGRPEAYLFDKRPNIGFFENFGMNEMFESVCSADHGTVLRYRGVNGQAYPVFSRDHNDRVMEWGFPKVRETLCHFADHLLLDGDRLNRWADVRSVSAELTKTFWSQPSRLEAEVWGAFPMEDGWGREAIYHCFAEPYGWRDVKRVLLAGSVERRHWWHEGAMAQSSLMIRFAFKGCRKVGRWQRQVRQKLQLKKRLKYRWAIT